MEEGARVDTYWPGHPERVRVERDEIRFAQLSDTHIEINDSSGIRKYEESVELTRRAIEEINSMDLDFVIVAGDLINDGHHYNLDAAYDVLGELEIPYFVVLGNNDVPLTHQNEQLSRFDFVYAFQGHGFHGNQTYWSTDVARHIHLIGLDLNKPGTGHTYISKAQLKWLARDLERNKDKLTLIVTHQPLVAWNVDPDSQAAVLPEMEELYELLDLHEQVAFVFSGHYHQTRIFDLGGFFQIVAPQLISYPHAHRTYRLNSKMLEMDFYQVGEDEFLDESRRQVLDSIREHNPDATDEEIAEIFSVYEPYDSVAHAMLPARW
jgi:3',5'-cyclic AMP phosphodiesterase CpdA